MKRGKSITLVAVGLIAGLVLGSLSIASAAPATDPATDEPLGMGARIGWAVRDAGARLSDIVADLTGLDVEDVQDRRADGETIADIAESEGYSADAVLEFLNEKCIPVWEMTPISVVAAMIKVTGAYAFPVLDNNAKLSGIVTDRDIFNVSQVGESVATTDLGLGEDEDAWTWEGLRNVMKLWYEVHSLDLPAVPVKEIMIKDPTTVFSMTSVSNAAREMRKNDFGQLPVRDDEDNLIGMVYDLDIIRALIQK